MSFSVLECYRKSWCGRLESGEGEVGDERSQGDEVGVTGVWEFRARTECRKRGRQKKRNLREGGL